MLNTLGLSYAEKKFALDVTVMATNEKGDFSGLLASVTCDAGENLTVYLPIKINIGAVTPTITKGGASTWNVVIGGKLANPKVIGEVQGSLVHTLGIMPEQKLRMRILPYIPPEPYDLPPELIPPGRFPGIPCAGQIVTFNASDSYDPDGYIISYEWNFGDNTSIITGCPITTHVYKVAGIYYPILTVMDNGNLSAASITEVHVSSLPVGGYSVPITIPFDKFAFAPYIGLASTILVAAVATAVYVKRVKRKKEKQ